MGISPLRRQPIFLHALSGATELRSNTPFPGGSPFLGSRFVVQPSRVSDTPFPGGDFALCGARENGAPARGLRG